MASNDDKIARPGAGPTTSLERMAAAKRKYEASKEMAAAAKERAAAAKERVAAAEENLAAAGGATRASEDASPASKEVTRALKAAIQAYKEVFRTVRKLERAANEFSRVYNKALEPMTLKPFLEAHHRLHRAIIAKRGRVQNTHYMYDDVVPTRRVYPQRIVPWDGFPAQQAEMWRLLLSTRSATGSMDATSAPFAPFASRRAFSSQHSVDYSMEIINRPGISGGAEFWRAIEDPVRWLVGSVFDDAMLRRRFGPCRAVGFAMHYGYNVYGFTDTHDGYSVRMADGTRIPVTAAVHIMPDKLSPDEIFTGLAGATVDPGRDIINRDRRDAGDSAFVFASKTLTTAAVTKLFAYMVRKCVRYGYICTGDVLVFLHIPGDDPTTALYHVCVPDVDVGEEEDDNSHLLRTAAAQVFAFTLQAFCAPPPTTSWVRAAHLLDKWEFSYEGVLSGIPTRVRETKEHALPYRPNHGRGCMRCPSKASSSVAGKRKRRAAEDEDTASDKGHNEHGTKKPRPAQCLSTGTC